MHTEFQKYLRKNGRGIDYTALENFDTENSLEEILSKQRKPAEDMLRRNIKSGSNKDGWDWAMENARRLKIDKTNPELFNEAKRAYDKFLQSS